MKKIRHHVIVGLSLLCAVAICGSAAQTASAAVAKNTTAFTCVEEAKGQFSDAHCDNKVPLGEGKFGQVGIPANTPTEIAVTNEKTSEGTKTSAPWIFRFKLPVTNEIICSSVTSEKGLIQNVESVAGEHRVAGEITLLLSSCKTTPMKCVFKKIELKLLIEGVSELGAEKNTMGLEFRSPEGKTFYSFKFEGPECVLKGNTIPLEGIAIATGAPKPTEKHGGATWNFTPEMTSETMSFFGHIAEISASLTARMAPVEGKEQNPISLTTAT